MILEQLRLRNFCLFRGKQTLRPLPAGAGRPSPPIILFGGLNGGGKTTLLDAIQLALYGSQAKCSKRAGTSYDDFLRHSIHHGVGPEEGASVVLSFRYFTEGEEHLYEVCRAWQVVGGQVREELGVFKNGSPNSWLSDHWPQLVEELIPLEVSQLFFFDAEKIRSLAEDESSSKMLGTAIKALLGLDIVERLVADATVLQTRLVKEAGGKERKTEIEALQQRLREIETALGGASGERATLQNRLDRAKAELKTAEDRFSAGGGKHWERRERNNLRLVELKHQKEHLEKAIRDVAGGESPLALVSGLMCGLLKQASLEAGTARTLAGWKRSFRPGPGADIRPTDEGRFHASRRMGHAIPFRRPRAAGTRRNGSALPRPFGRRTRVARSDMRPAITRYGGPIIAPGRPVGPRDRRAGGRGTGRGRDARGSRHPASGRGL